MAPFRLPILLATLVVFPAPAVAAGDICQSLLDANLKIYSMPVHVYTTETAVFTGGKARTNELIYLNGKTYLQIAGKWRVSPQTPKQMQEIRKEAEAGAKVTCKFVREEPVNGEAAVLYNAHQETEDAKIDSQVWVSKARGVPLKTESDSDVGGAGGKVHRTLRYEYSNVQAPM
jgi:outer membrane lipoprotein-sorting protein